MGKKKDRHPVDGVDGQFGDQNVVARGKRLGDHFTEDQDQKGHQAGGHPHGVIGRHADGQGCGDGRGRDIDHVVADQDGGQQFVGFVLHPFDQLMRGDIVLGHMPGTGWADGKRAVSAEEKKPENNNNTSKIRSWSSIIRQLLFYEDQMPDDPFSCDGNEFSEAGKTINLTQGVVRWAP